MSTTIRKPPRRSFQSPESYDLEQEALSQQHQEWKSWAAQERERFFPIFSDFMPHLATLSPGAVKLFVYLGLKSNIQTGEVKVSMQAMEPIFCVTRRTLFNWLSELEDHNLIQRMQPGKKRISLTFLLPYSKRFAPEAHSTAGN